MRRLYILMTLAICLTACLIPSPPARGAKAAPPSRCKYDAQTYINKGKDALMLRANPDSAIYYFSKVANRYYEKSLPEAELESCILAMHNIGYIYSFYLFDYQKAYYYTKEAIAVSKKHNLPQVIPYSLVTMGHIYLTYWNIYEQDNYWRIAMDNYHNAFREGARQGNGDVMVTALLGICHNAMERDSLQYVAREISIFRKAAIDRSTPLYPYTLKLLEGLEQYNSGDTLGALAKFEEAYRRTDFAPSEMREKVLAGMHAVKLRQILRPDESQDRLLNEITDICETNGSFDLSVEAYRTLADMYSRLGNRQLEEHYRYKYLIKKDSVFSHCNVASIDRLSLLDQLDQANINIRSQQRTHALYLAIIILVVLMIVVLSIFTVNIFRQKRELTRKNIALYQQTQEMLKVNKYQYSSLDDDRKHVILEKIDVAMKDRPEVYEAGVTLEAFADLIGEKKSHISQIINESYGKNFRTFLNEYRIREACRCLEDDRNFGHLTIDAIASDLGFKSRTNFIATFKKVTGLSPSEYRRIHESEVNALS